MAESLFPHKGKSIENQLAYLCQMRQKVEQKQQVLLSRSVSLARFIRIAALDHIRDLPEIENARKLLAQTMPRFGLNNKISAFSDAAFSTSMGQYLRNLN